MPGIYHKCMIACVVSLVQLSDCTDCSPPGSSVLEISQTRILEWVANSSSRGYSGPRDWTCLSCVSCNAGRLYQGATGEAQTTNGCYNSVPEVFPWLAFVKKKSLVKCFSLLAQNKAKLTLLFLPVQPQSCLMIWIRVKKKKKRERERETPSPPPLQNPKQKNLSAYCMGPG